ncbi:MAG: GAF domain-containing protein [Chloroflexi bacterium]|nr:GAF domain-containing protein [Chloroflexota bacterium]MBI3763133.1 GAF domain-containing protein [Chloroflexota bacterium]
MTQSPSESPNVQTGTLRPEWVTLLFAISREFASTLELDEVLAKALNLTTQTLGANVGSIFLLDSEGRAIRSILARSNLPPEIKSPTVAAVMSKGLAGWVYQHGRADIVLDTQADDRWFFFAGDTLVTRSAMAAPLLRRNEVIGIVTLQHPEPNHFTRRQLELLEAIAAQAASAVENASLYTRVANERATLQSIVGGVHDNILVTDLKRNLILANPAAFRSLALGQQAYGRPVGEVAAEPALIEFYQSARDDEIALKEVMLEDGRVFDCALVRLPGVGQMLSMHDVTTFKRLDALKDEFVSHVAHDLKAPLSIMQGYAWVLNEMPGLAEDALDHIQQILQAVDRMRALIDNILDIGRINMGIQAEFAPVSIASVVKESIVSMEALAKEKKVILSSQVAADLPPVNGAQVRLGQAVTNLVGNALKFTPADGSVTVGAAMEAGQIVVRVVDTGPGIPPALQSKLFQKFSRLGQKETRKEEGHGLGLAIVKSVIDAHGGRVWVESQVGQGSTFAFSLPLSQPTREDNPSETRPAPVFTEDQNEQRMRGI